MNLPKGDSHRLALLVLLDVVDINYHEFSEFSFLSCLMLLQPERLKLPLRTHVPVLATIQSELHVT